MRGHLSWRQFSPCTLCQQCWMDSFDGANISNAPACMLMFRMQSNTKQPPTCMLVLHLSILSPAAALRSATASMYEHAIGSVVLGFQGAE